MALRGSSFGRGASSLQRFHSSNNFENRRNRGALKQSFFWRFEVWNNRIQNWHLKKNMEIKSMVKSYEFFKQPSPLYKLSLVLFLDRKLHNEESGWKPRRFPSHWSFLVPRFHIFFTNPKALLQPLQKLGEVLVKGLPSHHLRLHAQKNT